MKSFTMSIPLTIVLLVLIAALTAGGFLFYQEYKENNAYERRQAQERMKEERREEMYDIADGAADWVVKKAYKGGRAIDWDINSWSYNDYKGEYKINISINWKGKNFNGYYAADGVIRADDDEVTWEPTWQNDKLEEYLDWRNILGIAIGSVAVLGALSEVSN